MRRAGVGVSGAFVLACLVSGCGYVLGTTGVADGKPAGVLSELAASHRLEVETFADETAEPGAALSATRACREKLALRPVPEAPADASTFAVSGRVLSVDAKPVAFDAALVPTLWRLSVTVEVTVGPSGGPAAAVAKSDASVEFPAGTLAEGTETSRRLALVRALEAAIDAGLGRLVRVVK